ncbi:MAG: sugar ABC transporter substrate-binding protein, partial [Oscillospiraceae bacterium]
NKGMDLDDLGLILPPAGPSGKSATAIAGDCWVINSKTDVAKQDAAWEYVSFMVGKEQRSAFYENLSSKGSIAPVTIPRTDMAITDFTELPQEWAPILSSVGEIGRMEFYGKADFGSYVDRAVQKILSDLNADPEKEFGDAQALAEKEALATFNEANKKA